MIGFASSPSSRAVALLLAASQSILFAQDKSVEERLKALETQNDLLRHQVAEQQKTIDQLKDKVSPETKTEEITRPKGGFDFGNIHISGEGGAGYFHSGSDGQYPEGAFRLDEAKLFVEAPLWKDTYFFGELNLIIRESDEEYFELGEL